MEVAGMSYVIADPEFVAAAAADLAELGSTITAANVAALAPTSNLLAAGADEVSASIAAMFSAHAQAHQALCTEDTASGIVREIFLATVRPSVQNNQTAGGLGRTGDTDADIRQR
jgi:hypothetical protein